MSDPDLTPSFDEVGTTDAITGTSAGSDPEMGNASDDSHGAGSAGGTGDELAVDREEQFRLANDVATNDAVAGETVLGESAPLDETPYTGGNELGGDVDLGETEDR